MRCTVSGIPACEQGLRDREQRGGRIEKKHLYRLSDSEAETYAGRGMSINLRVAAAASAAG